MPLDKDSTTTAVAAFRKDGFLWLQDLFSPDLIHRLNHAYQEICESTDADKALLVGDKRRMYTVKIQPPFDDPILFDSPELLPILAGLLDTDLSVQGFGGVCAFPGATVQHRHSDHGILFQKAPLLATLLPPFAIAVGIPLCDFTEETGSTAFWPGTHTKPNLPPNQDRHDLTGSVIPYPKVGDCVLFDCRVLHAGTANISDTPRGLLYVVYSLSWFEDRQNYKGKDPLLISEASFQALSDRQKKLLFRAKRIP